MIFLNKKEEEDIPDKKFKDLKPENRKKRKEPIKAWGKKERLVVLIALIATILISCILALLANGSETFSFPKISLPSFTFFTGETTVIEK